MAASAIFLATALAAGLAGAGAMELVMWAAQRTSTKKRNMVVALGSLVTKSRDGAEHLGRFLHLCSGAAFGIGYTLLMTWMHVTRMPGSLMLGLGVGFLHGMIVSLGLMFVIAERHPLAEFQEVDLAIALSHLIAHVAYGGIVGLIVGVAPL